MTKRDNTYQNARVNLIQGGQILSIDDNGWFDFYGTSITGQEMKGAIAYMAKVSVIGQGAASTVFSNTNIPNSAKYVVFSLTSNVATGSAWLCSGPLLGQEMWIRLARGSVVASGMILISTSGVTIKGLQGSAVSIIRLYNSAASCGAVHLACLADGEWSIMSTYSYGVVTGSSVPD